MVSETEGSTTVVETVGLFTVTAWPAESLKESPARLVTDEPRTLAAPSATTADRVNESTWSVPNGPKDAGKVTVGVLLAADSVKPTGRSAPFNVAETDPGTRVWRLPSGSVRVAA